MVGEHSRGSYDVWATRQGATRRRLMVLPPGATDADRIALRGWQLWPVAGAVLWVALVFCGMERYGNGAAVGASVLYLVGLWLTHRWSVGIRAETRVAESLTVEAGEGADGSVATAQVLACAAELQMADHLVQVGAMTVVDHEVVWDRVYRMMPQR